MKLTKLKLKELIKEELSYGTEESESLEEGAYAGEEDPRTEWLVERVGELFRRVTELEKQIGVDWLAERKGEGDL